ncbi:MAG TPA: hypothetical protein VNK96_07690 [Fimbriimonadales bacterium]|nr:hypothetical protein [Fimbriimonadales bacterium]
MLNREDSSSAVRGSSVSPQTAPARPEATVIEPERDYPNGVPLRVVFQPGEKVTRKIKGKIEVLLDKKQLRKGEKPKATSLLEVVYTSTTHAVKDGIAELEISSEPVKVQTDSGEPGYWQAENSTVKIDEYARVFSETTNVVRGIHGIGFIPFPKKRVIPGSTWKSVTNREVPLLGLMRVTEKYTYKGIQEANGKKTWRIDLLVQDSAKRFGSTGSYFFDTENGQLVEAAVTMRFEGDIETPTGQKRHAKVIFFVRVEPFDENTAE